MILTGSNDNALKLWSTASGTCLQTFAKHTEAVTSCAWLPDSSSFVSGSLEKVIYLWNLQGEILHKWSGIRVMDLAVAGGGQTLIATSEKRIRVYDLDSKAELLYVFYHLVVTWDSYRRTK